LKFSIRVSILQTEEVSSINTPRAGIPGIAPAAKDTENDFSLAERNENLRDVVTRHCQPDHLWLPVVSFFNPVAPNPTKAGVGAGGFQIP
jgi:hypothetical protein